MIYASNRTNAYNATIIHVPIYICDNQCHSYIFGYTATIIVRIDVTNYTFYLFKMISYCHYLIIIINYYRLICIDIPLHLYYPLCSRCRHYKLSVD